jgi:hypothetical protein
MAATKKAHKTAFKKDTRRATNIGWNDSDGEPIALVFAQEHGAGLEAWQTRTRREDSSIFGRW